MSMKPSEFGVMDGCVQTATTYLILKEWCHDLRQRRPAAFHPNAAASNPELAKWWDEFRLMADEVEFCATLLGDQVHFLHNLWEDARVERQLKGAK